MDKELNTGNKYNPDEEYINSHAKYLKHYGQAVLTVDALDKIIYWQYEYIQLLREELDEVVGLARLHGWKTTRFEKGEEIRNHISEANKELAKIKSGEK